MKHFVDDNIKNVYPIYRQIIIQDRQTWEVYC